MNLYLYFIIVIFIWSGTVSAQTSFTTTKKFHLITNARQTWNKALHYCNSRGWRLAGITKKEENDQIIEHITNTGLRDSFWIGGTNLFNEPYFYWMGNDSPFIYTDWHINEPNNLHLNENCISIWYENNVYKWIDQPCRTKNYFVCEERISLLPGGLSLHNTLAERFGPH